MVDMHGPAVDPDAFEVVGHCCSVRFPVLQTLTGEGLNFEFTPEVLAELIADGALRQPGLDQGGEEVPPTDRSLQAERMPSRTVR
jgi:hypothetical protein